MTSSELNSQKVYEILEKTEQNLPVTESSCQLKGSACLSPFNGTVFAGSGLKSGLAKYK